MFLSRVTVLLEAQNYNYDEISRLVLSEIIPPPTGTSPFQKGRSNTKINTSYIYDNVGNRDSVEQTTIWETKKGKEKEKVKISDYTNNALNQYTSLESYQEKDEQDNKKNKVKNFMYDNAGNLIQDNKQKYFYDYKNRLVRVSSLKNEVIVEYCYDTLGRRVEKISGDELTQYIYAGNNAIVEDTYEQEKGKWKLEETKENIYTNTIDDILASIITKDGKANVYYYTKNQLGSITAITDNSGKVVEEYKYDVFGKAYIRDGKSDNWREFKDSKIGNERLFTGREYDREIGLYYYRARYYSPELGRFISRDPIGQVDDINLYSYVGNNSVNFVDPMGREKQVYGELYNFSNAIFSYAVSEIGLDLSIMGGYLANTKLYYDSMLNQDNSLIKDGLISLLPDYNMNVSAYMLLKFKYGFGTDDYYGTDHWISQKVIATNFYQNELEKAKQIAIQEGFYSKSDKGDLTTSEMSDIEGLFSDFPTSFGTVDWNITAKIIDDGKIETTFTIKDTYIFNDNHSDGTPIDNPFNKMGKYRQDIGLGTPFNWNLNITQTFNY